MAINFDKILQNKYPGMAKLFAANGYSIKDIQRDAINRIVGNKRSTLCLMPTGGGKSLIYWLAGAALERITIVISPLIALIDEQTTKLRNEGRSVLAIHGGIDSKNQTELLMDLINNKNIPEFLFVSPERMATDGFFEFCLNSIKDQIGLVVIDEIHCVSQWGADFRPFYKRIPDFLTSLFNDNWPTILGLSATINPYDIQEICEDFRISKKDIIRDDFLIRGEIELIVIKLANEEEKEDKLWKLLQIHKGEKTLVYLYRKYNKRGTENLRDIAIEKGFKAVNFHGDMSSSERQQIIAAFKNNETEVVFATNAFGMGIDIPDIRVVIHFMIPESIEQYYQEIGRAARDGKASQAYLLFTNKNVKVRRDFFIDKGFPTKDQIIKFHANTTNNIPGYKIVPYFDDEEAQTCLHYLLNSIVWTFSDKTIADLSIFSVVNNQELDKLAGCTRTKMMVSTIEKSGKTPKEISSCIYSSIVDGTVKLKKAMDKRILIHSANSHIEDAVLDTILMDINCKRTYKHELLDFLVYLLNGFEQSKELHQDIGRYLGVDKHKLGRIFKCQSGERLRSKSEVIIANLLTASNIPFAYEEKLFYGEEGKWIEPDFTIRRNGKIFYWEHLGMIGTEKYDNRWLEKQVIYSKYYADLLRITYEGATIAESASDLIKEIIRDSEYDQKVKSRKYQ